jgi:exopolyphosphatase/pppGpp-phosphohydrolase
VAALQTGKYTEEAIKDTADAVEKFHKQMQQEFKVPPEHIYVVGSSGLPRADNQSELVAAIKQRTGKDMSILSMQTELGMASVSIVPRQYRNNALVIDIGSGLTKCGLCEVATLPVGEEIPFGSVTFAAKIKEGVKRDDFQAFIQAADRKRAEIEQPLRDEVVARHPAVVNRERAYLSGGVVWALVTLLYPEEYPNSYVRIKADDIDRFHALLVQGAGHVPTPDLSGISDEDLRKKAEAEVQKVKDVFTAEQLVAGTEILRAACNSFHLRQSNKELYFPREGYLAWINYYVLEMAADNGK